jgi:uncharacterized protein with von Willebrand factor type A (vWA) domain
METLKEAARRAEEAPRGRQQDGSAPAARRPFGANGYNPEGVRIGQDKGRHGKAVKVWDKREYKNLDDSVELGTRNIKVALRRLRKFAREGAPTSSISTARSGNERATQGYLDIHAPRAPQRRQGADLLRHRRLDGQRTSSSARSCSAPRAPSSRTSSSSTSTTASMRACGRTTAAARPRKDATWDVLHKFPSDYKVIFVGDATMSPYEITYPGGSVEHWNEEPGAIWVDRVTEIYDNVVWLNPTAERHWDYTQSIGVMKQLVNDRMSRNSDSGRPRRDHSAWRSASSNAVFAGRRKLCLPANWQSYGRFLLQTTTPLTILH